MNGFFKPSDITTRLCTVDGKTNGGSAFAICENGERVFLSPKIVSAVEVEVGDMVFAYCVDNYRDAEGYARYSARWRAIRVEIKERFRPVVPVEVPVQVEVPTEAAQEAPQEAAVNLPAVVTQGSIGGRVAALLEEGGVWSARMICDRLDTEMNPTASWLWHKHRMGEIASARLYVGMDQKHASHVYYAKDTATLRKALES